MLHKPQRHALRPGYQKVYLSREVSRAWSIDHPVGDPKGGPAYGERNDPISAVLSIASIASGLSVGGIVGGLMVAGGALSLVGNITGNKFLSTMGMVAGAVGGLGAAGVFGEGFKAATFANTFGGASSAAPALSGAQGVAGAADDVAAAASAASPTVANTPAAFSTPLASPASLPSPVALPDVVPNVAPLTQTNLAANGAISSGSLLSPSASLAAPAPLAPSVAAPSVPTISDMISDPLASSGAGFKLPGSGPSVQFNANSPSGGGLLDSVMGFASKNPGAALMLGNVATNISDVISGKTDAQINQLEAAGQLTRAQADYYRQQTELTKQRIANQNNNYTNVRSPLATSWTPPIQATPGLIAGARQGG